MDLEDVWNCGEKHIGKTPRSIMTKGTSTRRKNLLPGSLYGNFDPGNNDKLMITYRREPSHNYSMNGACSVIYQGDIHFFGGYPRNEGSPQGRLVSLHRQHFVIETRRSGKQVKMTQMRDLEIGISAASCSSFDITSNYFPGFSKNIVVLCFAFFNKKTCYSFDGKQINIGDSNYPHWEGGLTKYKRTLLTISGIWSPQKTELLKRNRNGTFIWSVVESEFIFTEGHHISYHSLVTIPISDFNEEYVLRIGGVSDQELSKNVFKFNGTWSHFGQLNKPRHYQKTIYWHGAVYVIGGTHGRLNGGDLTKMEIWKIEDSPDQFKTSENWPELDEWTQPHLYIVPDSFFPDK